MFGAGVDLQLAVHRVAHSRFRQHASKRFLDQTSRTALAQIDGALFAEPAFETAVAAVDLLLLLASRQLDRVGVDDDDVITGVDEGCVDRSMFALEQTGSNRGNSPENLTSRIYDVPPAVRAFRAGHKRTHE